MNTPCVVCKSIETISLEDSWKYYEVIESGMYVCTNCRVDIEEVKKLKKEITQEETTYYENKEKLELEKSLREVKKLNSEVKEERQLLKSDHKDLFMRTVEEKGFNTQKVFNSYVVEGEEIFVELDIPVEGNYVYLFELDGVTKYIGRTTNLKNRLTTHIKTSPFKNDFNTVKWVNFDKYIDSIIVEAALIANIQPQYNKDMTGRGESSLKILKSDFNWEGLSIKTSSSNEVRG